MRQRRFDRGADGEQPAVAALRAVERQADRQAARQADRQRQARDAGIAAGVGVADEGREGRARAAVQHHGLVLADARCGARRGREDERVDAFERARIKRLQPVSRRQRFAVDGFGHGAGMCQVGASRLGAAGRACRDILARYYPGSRAGWLYPVDES